MVEQDHPSGDVQPLGQQDEVGLFQLQEPAPDHPGRGHPAGEAHDDDQSQNLVGEYHLEGQHNDGGGDAVHHVHCPHHHVVHPAPYVAADAPVDQADEEGRRGGHRRHPQGHHPAVEDPGEHVPAQAVGAEPVGGAGGLEHPAQVHLGGAVHGKEGGEQAQGRDPQKEQHPKPVAVWFPPLHPVTDFLSLGFRARSIRSTASMDRITTRPVMIIPPINTG